jgi:hypothetical protein
MIRRMNQNTKGISLLEMLLALGTITGLMIAMMNILADFAQRDMARAQAKYMATIGNAAKEILRNPDYFEALYAAAFVNDGGFEMAAENGPDRTTDNNIAIGFTLPAITTGPYPMPAVTIQKSSMLNDNIKRLSPLGSQLRILLRITDDMTDTDDKNDPRGLEIIVAPNARYDNKMTMRIAYYLGPAGGWINGFVDGNFAIPNPPQYKSQTNEAKPMSVLGLWSFRILGSGTDGSLRNTRWYDLDGDPNTTTGGFNDKNKNGAKGTSFVIHYNYMTLEDTVGDYLYRRRDATDTTGRKNTMYGNLNIGGNNIIGADDVIVGETNKPFNATNGPAALCDGNVVCLRDSAVVKGSAYVGGTMTVNGDVQVADRANIQVINLRNAMNDANKTTYEANNNFIVNSTGATNDTIEVVNRVDIQDGMDVGTATFSERVRSNVLRVNNGGTVTTGSIGQELGNLTTTPKLNRMRVTGAATVNNFEAMSTLATGGLSADRVRGGGATTATFSSDVETGTLAVGGTLTTDVSDIDDMSISNFGTCTTGCGD